MLILTLTGTLSKSRCCSLSFICIELQKHMGHEFICRHLFRVMEIVDEERRLRELEVIFYGFQIERIHQIMDTVVVAMMGQLDSSTAIIVD